MEHYVDACFGEGRHDSQSVGPDVTPEDVLGVCVSATVDPSDVVGGLWSQVHELLQVLELPEDALSHACHVKWDAPTYHPLGQIMLKMHDLLGWRTGQFGTCAYRGHTSLAFEHVWMSWMLRSNGEKSRPHLTWLDDIPSWEMEEALAQLCRKGGTLVVRVPLSVAADNEDREDLVQLMHWATRHFERVHWVSVDRSAWMVGEGYRAETEGGDSSDGRNRNGSLICRGIWDSWVGLLHRLVQCRHRRQKLAEWLSTYPDWCQMVSTGQCSVLDLPDMMSFFREVRRLRTDMVWRWGWGAKAMASYPYDDGYLSCSTK